MSDSSGDDHLSATKHVLDDDEDLPDALKQDLRQIHQKSSPVQEEILVDDVIAERRYHLHNPVRVACSTRCPDCCISYFCICCLAYQHRLDVLGARFPRDYACCQDFLSDIDPMCVFCEPCTGYCPEICLCLESWFCTGCAITGSRFQLNKDNKINDRLFEKHSGWMLACLEICLCPGPWSLLSRLISSFLLIQQDYEMRMHLGIPSSLCYIGIGETQPIVSEKSPLLN